MYHPKNHPVLFLWISHRIGHPRDQLIHAMILISPSHCKNPIWAKSSSSITSNFNKASFCDILKFFGDISPGKRRQWEGGGGRGVLLQETSLNCLNWDPAKCVGTSSFNHYLYPEHQQFQHLHRINYIYLCIYLPCVFAFKNIWLIKYKNCGGN